MRAYYFRAALRAALKCASTDVMRPPLCGVTIGKDYVESTDGHRLMRVWWPGEFKRTGFVEAAAARRYVAWMRHDPKLNDDDFKQPAEILLPFSGIDPPETSKLWADKREAPAKSIWMNPAYVATLDVVWRILNPGVTPYVQFRIGGAEQPIYAEMKPDLFRVEFMVMPMRAPV